MVVAWWQSLVLSDLLHVLVQERRNKCVVRIYNLISTPTSAQNIAAFFDAAANFQTTHENSKIRFKNLQDIFVPLRSQNYESEKSGDEHDTSCLNIEGGVCPLGRMEDVNFLLDISAHCELYKKQRFLYIMQLLISEIDSINFQSDARTTPVIFNLIIQTGHVEAFKQFFDKEFSVPGTSVDRWESIHYVAVHMVMMSPSSSCVPDDSTLWLGIPENSYRLSLLRMGHDPWLGKRAIQTQCTLHRLLDLGETALAQQIRNHGRASTEDLDLLVASEWNKARIMQAPADKLKLTVAVDDCCAMHTDFGPGFTQQNLTRFYTLLRDTIIFPMEILLTHQMPGITAPRLLLYYNRESKADIIRQTDEMEEYENWEEHLARECGRSLGLLIVKVNASALISAYVGDTEKNIRAAFTWRPGQETEPDTIKGVILIMDGIDLIGKPPSEDGDDTSRLYSRCVTTLLLCLDGIDTAAGLPVAVIAKTNLSPQQLDSRLLRPGRLHRSQRLL
eukprot:Gregarina_sp_Poly_1__8016@NODE_45_length_17866_cov_75_803753_g39_i0_p4_GENE_NODE_45_length_17866_cov_75_803753_g39_i0NODE_45_length_17866_cov_75_803753_g39_i0_p4_ORF_typecomplete_len504_score51_87AAA/PF00004_29/1_8e04AAA/PF00004_29/1_8e11_NODE_45_length_17866_cov_75_803753_g39_i048006311